MIVDEYQKTSVLNIHSVGDCCGKWELTPVAITAGQRLARRLFDTETWLKLEYHNFPTVVFRYGNKNESVLHFLVSSQGFGSTQ